MADYWKSQPRKFCQYCKCWIADNKPSIDFHERGKNHKENVAAKISEIKKKSVQKAKQDERMCKQFAAMEEAAMKAYEEDLKRMEREAAFGPEAETASTTSTYQPVPTVQPPKQPQANKQEPKQKKPQKKIPHPRPPHSHHPQHSGAALWVEGKSDEGYTYYYNTVTGESRWNKPEETKREVSHDGPPGSTQTSSKCAWMEAVSPEGYTYYYNTVTRASSWEKPADYTPKEGPGSSDQGKGQGEESNTEKAVNAEEGGEATSEQPSTQTETTEQSTVPKIQLRKRKADADSSEETSKTPEETPKESEEESKQEDSRTTESEKKEEKQDETPTGRFRPPNPYGTWERIKMEKDPYANVDWQLPQVQGGEDSATVDLPPEPKHKFKTRVITSLGDSASSTGPVAFKKKKAQNGKSRRLRQRDEDD